MSSYTKERKANNMIVSADNDDSEKEEYMLPSQLLWTRRWEKPWATLESFKAAGTPVDMQTLLELSKMLNLCYEKATFVQKMYRGYLTRKPTIA